MKKFIKVELKNNQIYCLNIDKIIYINKNKIIMMDNKYLEVDNESLKKLLDTISEQ